MPETFLSVKYINALFHLVHKNKSCTVAWSGGNRLGTRRVLRCAQHLRLNRSPNMNRQRSAAMAEPALRVIERESMDKNKALDAALTQIERAFGKGSIMRMGQEGAAVDIASVPTGC